MAQTWFGKGLGWTTPTGKAKRAQCTSFLEKLEEAGLIQLPPLDVSKQRRTLNSKITEFQIDNTPINCELKAIKSLHLEIARAGTDLKRWRHYVNEYHMLGDKKVFGSRFLSIERKGD